MTPLRQRMLEDMQVRNLSPNTQRAYVESVTRFARHCGRSPVDLLLAECGGCNPLLLGVLGQLASRGPTTA